MSCHISALCIALPCPKRGPAETTLGRGIHGGWRKHPSRPFKAPTTPQPLPPPCGGRGGDTFEDLPRHSPVPHKEEGGVQHLSLLRFTLERHTTCRRRILRPGDLFSGQSQRPPWRIGSQTRRRCFVESGLLYSQSEESQCPLISERLHTQVIDSELS